MDFFFFASFFFFVYFLSHSPPSHLTLISLFSYPPAWYTTLPSFSLVSSSVDINLFIIPEEYGGDLRQP